MTALAIKRECSVVLADDHGFIRSTVQSWLERSGRYRVVASVGTTDEAVQATARHRPALLILDIDMPGTICFSAAEQARQASPETRVLFLSAFHNDRFIREVLRVRGAGFVTKADSPESVMQAIDTAARGEIYFSERIRSRLVIGPDGVQLPGEGSTISDQLTTRELEVLRLVTRGLANKQIADDLGLSVRTVERHVCRLMEDLKLDSRAALAAFAVREGLAE